MTDTVSRERRSWIMSRVKGKDTAPELFVRSLVHRLGYRFRLHRRDLPGAPDLVFVSRRKVIFVHGCFWHGHNCVRGDRQPKSNSDYWKRKIAKNKERDRSRRKQLRDLGWDVLVVWECQLRDEEKLTQELIAFLGDRPARRSNS
jgi:DNA mismatch endonuclease (patch repair protein)